MESNTASLGNERPWYEGPDGTCNLEEPTLVNMGEGRPLHLMYPVYWAESLEVLPEAKKMAHDVEAMLVLLIYGEAPDSEVANLIIQLASAEVLPLWIGEHNRRKVDNIISILSSQAPSKE